MLTQQHRSACLETGTHPDLLKAALLPFLDIMRPLEQGFCLHFTAQASPVVLLLALHAQTYSLSLAHPSHYGTSGGCPGIANLESP